METPDTLDLGRFRPSATEAELYRCRMAAELHLDAHGIRPLSYPATYRGIRQARSPQRIRRIVKCALALKRANDDLRRAVEPTAQSTEG